MAPGGALWPPSYGAPPEIGALAAIELLDCSTERTYCFDSAPDGVGSSDPWFGTGCAMFNSYTHYCGSYDGVDFASADMCCGCGGGTTTNAEFIATGGACSTNTDGYGYGFYYYSFYAYDDDGAGLRSGTLADGSYGIEWMCLEDGCYELLVGGGAADSEIGLEFLDEVGGHFQDLSAPYADHFCVAAGDVFDHPTVSPTVTQVPTPGPTVCLDTNNGADVTSISSIKINGKTRESTNMANFKKVG